MAEVDLRKACRTYGVDRLTRSARGPTAVDGVATRMPSGGCPMGGSLVLEVDGASTTT